MSIVIRAAKPEDIFVIAGFNRKMAMETEGKTLPEEIIVPGVKAVLEDPFKGRYFVAMEKDVLLGQLMITMEWSDWRNSWIWWIQSVYVLPEARKRGIYKSLYEEVRREAGAEGVRTIRLYVEKDNGTARKVYEKLGMEESVYALYEATLQ